MSGVPVRPGSGPINRTLALAAGAAAFAWWTWPEASDAWQRMLIAGFAAVGAVAAGAEGAVLLVRDYRLRRDLARAEQPTGDHGVAREATWAELAARGMDKPRGNFLGLYQGKHPVFAPADAPFSLAEMPPGGGKTSRLVIASILHQAQLGKAVIVADPKQELGPMLAPALRRLGFEVWRINPVGRHSDEHGNTELNPYQSVLDAVYATDATRLDAIKRAADLAELHLPEKGGDDKNLYFRSGARRCIVTAILYLALTDPARCTPSDVFALLNDAGRFSQVLGWIRKHLETGALHEQ